MNNRRSDAQDIAQWVAAAVLAMAGALVAAPFEIIVLPDTQNYVKVGSPNILDDQTKWIVDNKVAENIVFVAHEGDLVDDGGSTTQWERASAAMSRLDGVVPYGIAWGNHDQDHGGAVRCIRYFGNKSIHFSRKNWYGGVSPDGLSSYQRFSVAGYSFLNLSLRNDGIDDPSTVGWARQLLASNSNKLVILTTHDYLVPKDGAGQYSPDDGRLIYASLVRPYSNVIMVLNGHSHAERQEIDTNNAGGKVASMLANYQDDPNGGNGWLRKIQFDPDNGRINVYTFSPTLGTYRNSAEALFSFNATFNPVTNSIAIIGAGPQPKVPTDQTLMKPLPATQKPAVGFTNKVYSQKFESVNGRTMPAGWMAYEIAGHASDLGNGVSASTLAAKVAAATEGDNSLLLLPAADDHSKAKAQLYLIGTTDHCLASSPTENAANVFDLALLNDTGSTMTGMKVKFDMKLLTRGSQNDGERGELPGLSFLYSTDGNTWIAVDGLRMAQGDAVGTYAAPETRITFASGVPAGSRVLLRWVDDNANVASPDALIGLDNVQVTAIAP